MLSLVTFNVSLITFSSCSEPESSLVEFVEDNTLSTPNDTVYSLLGIVGKMQQIADRTVLLGELRGDLTSLTDYANLDLQALANFTADASNPYNKISDYYAVIQNCNYFLAKADMNLMKRGVKVFEKEYAAIKAYRAWTYMQLALNYGSVPFFTEPLLTEKDADPELFPKYDIKQIAEYFIKDLDPYVDTEYPAYGQMGGNPSQTFYIPVRVLLGDLCLWAERYTEAAKYYHDYLTKTGSIHPTGTSSAKWEDYKFESVIDRYSAVFVTPTTDEILTIIPMEQEEFDGTISTLDDVFNSTEDNNYYYQAEASASYKELSRSQRNVLVYSDPVTLARDTVSQPEGMIYSNENWHGDLRLAVTYVTATLISNSTNYSSLYQKYAKCIPSFVTIYRLQHVYLRYAEALNRAGFPDAAFFVLKYGLCNDYMDKYMSTAERAAAGELISFSGYTFTSGNTQGIHSRGSGDANADKTYVIPELPSKTDSILYVEDKLCEEMALETAGEGLRFYDLMRIALRRNDPAFLARKVASRGGFANFDSNLYTLLTDKSKWYLPLK
ncbi:MAG: RagB/SusD family nutrient uptake outer membrane protein [Bacteroidaceae bacterium]|nr:RagB/SusD family nutrient uptake outer membrane protein [Bacteroidaceae bacterium]